MTRWRGVSLWCALLAGLLVCAYGLWTHRPWRQEIWTPTGSRRLAITVTAFAIFWIVGVWRRYPVLPIVLGAVAIATMAITGPLPVVALVYFAVSSWAFGRLLFRRDEQMGDFGEEVISFLVGASVWQLLVGLAAHLPINNALTYTVAFALPIATQPRRMRAAWRSVRTHNWRMPTPLTAGFAVFPLVAHWMAAMRPEASADGLAMHLVIPSSVAQHGFWWYDVERYSWAVMPLGGDWAYTAVYLLGGEWSAHLLNFAFLCAITSLVVWIAAMWVPLSTAWIVGGLFTATPLVYLITGSLFIENFQAAMLLGAFIALALAYERTDGRLLAVAATLMGSAATAKLGSLVYAAPLLLVGVFASRAMSRMLRIIALAMFVGIASIPYVTAWVSTGNPVFPFMNAVFRSPYFETAASFRDLRFASPLSWRTPYEAVFETSRFLEAQDGAIGYHFLVLAPICLLALACTRGRPWISSAALFTAAAGAALTWAGTSNVRYCYPAMPLIAIAIAGALANVRSSKLYPTVLGISAACIATGTMMLAASGWWKDFIVNPFDDSERREYMQTFAPGRVLVEHLNERYPGKPALFLVNGQTAGLRGRVYLNSWHNETFYRRLKVAASTASVSKLLGDEAIEQLVIPTAARIGELPNPILRAFVVQCTDVEYEVHGYAVASVRPVCRLTK